MNIYTKQTWKDEVRTPERTFSMSDAGDGKVQLIPAGTIVQKGSNLSATRFNHIEEGLDGAYDNIKRVGAIIDDRGNNLTIEDSVAGELTVTDFIKNIAPYTFSSITAANESSNWNIANKTYSENGVTITIVDGTHFIINGTATANIKLYFDGLSNTFTEKVTISAHSDSDDGGGNWNFEISDNSSVGLSCNTDSVCIDTGDTIDELFILIYSGTTFENNDFLLMIEPGDTPHPYVPTTGYTITSTNKDGSMSSTVTVTNESTLPILGLLCYDGTTHVSTEYGTTVFVGYFGSRAGKALFDNLEANVNSIVQGLQEDVNSIAGAQFPTGYVEQTVEQAVTEYVDENSASLETKAEHEADISAINETLDDTIEIIDNTLGYTIGASNVAKTYSITGNQQTIFYSNQRYLKFEVGRYLCRVKIKISEVSNLPSNVIFAPVFGGGSVGKVVAQSLVSNSNMAISLTGNMEEYFDVYFDVATSGVGTFGIDILYATGATLKYEISELSLVKFDDYSQTYWYMPCIKTIKSSKYGSKYYIDANVSQSDVENLTKIIGHSNVIQCYDNMYSDYSVENVVSDAPTNAMAILSSKIKNRGGKIYIPNGVYVMNDAVYVQGHCQTFEGETWGYSGEPNGVFEINAGTKLRFKRMDTSAFIVNTIKNGLVFKNLGIQGNATDSNTKGLFDYSTPYKNSGLFMQSGRTDQTLFDHICCTGLACGMSINPEFNMDACTVDWLNADGCNVGLFIKSNNMYYTVFRNCVLSDCPAQGLIVDSESGISYVIFDRITLVRNGGGMTDAQKAVYPACSAFIRGVNYSTFNDVTINDAGLWTEYFSDSPNKTTHWDSAIGLYFSGNYNRITNMSIGNSADKFFDFYGNNNKIATSDFGGSDYGVIHGDNNIISGCSFKSNGTYSLEIAGNNNTIICADVSKPILISGNNNKIIGVSSTLVVDNGTGNVIS